METQGIEQIIRSARVCRLGLTDGNEPYVVPVFFGYHEGRLYFHGKSDGRKMRIIRDNPRVCFEMDCDFELVRREVACRWGLRYRSVIGYATASVVIEAGEKRAALHYIMSQYSDSDWQFDDESLARTTVVRLEIESMTGRQSGY